MRQKRQLAAAHQSAAAAASDSCFVQLPAQSYAEHRGCGFGQSLVETVQHHPRRWAACGATLALLLLIVLCATLVPAAQRRRQRPQFLVPPAVAGTGASWIDLAVQLDRPALVSWMAFRQADINQAVPGMGGTTLLELIQEEGVKAVAVYAASSAAASLDTGASPQPGLQQLAVACGWAPVGNTTDSSRGPAAARVSLLSAAGASAAACTAASAAASSPGRCARCPRLNDSTPYTLLLVAASAGSGAVGRAVQVVNALTGDASVNVNSLDPPYADNATATSFDLHFKLNSPGEQELAATWPRQLLRLEIMLATGQKVHPPDPALPPLQARCTTRSPTTACLPLMGPTSWLSAPSPHPAAQWWLPTLQPLWAAWWQTAAWQWQGRGAGSASQWTLHV